MKDPYQILLEEHIIRRNAGLPSESPDDYMARCAAEESDRLNDNADKHETTTTEDEGDDE